MQKVGAYTERVTGDGEWRGGNPATGQTATPMLSAYFNMVQRELCSLVEAAGMQLDINDDGQLLKAIRGGLATINANGNLPAGKGLLLLDASAGSRTFTLPSSASVGTAEMTVRRLDLTANTCTIAASGTDKILLDTIAAAAGISATELLFAGDYLRLRSDGAGKWWCVGQAQLPGSLNTGFVVYSEAGSFTFTVPAVLRSGRRQADVTCIGGGGGGGNSTGTGTGQAGSGGGGGGISKKRIDLTGVTTVTVTVGVGGAAQMAGGTSSFGAYMSATGGNGAGPSRGSAGTGVGGDLNDTLGYGFQRHTNGSAQVSGKGAGPGGGASIENGTIVGDTALSFGCGGGGGTGGAAGGVGSRGLVSIEW